VKTFQQIEQTLRSSPVVTDDPTYNGSGTLILDGPKSSAVLQSGQSLVGRADEDGWFNLRLKASNGRPVLLHKALTTSSKAHSAPTGRNYEEHIYPNTVILGADALAAGNRVAGIAFTLRKIESFFHFEHVEHQSLYQAPAAFLSTLRKRRTKRRVPHDLFKPSGLYLVHQFPVVFSFRVDGHRYEVFVGSSTQSGWQMIELSTDPILSITFAAPVEIEQAIDAVWAWKRYFGTVALLPADLTSLAARSGRGRFMKEADFYLPAQAGAAANVRGPFSMWPGNVPLNRWRERKALGQVMQVWIEKEAERQRFRGSVENVSARMHERVSVEDIVTLCAGIESLPDLASRSAVTADQVKQISDGAIAAAKANGIEIDDNRVRGVLGLLRNQSLPQRLTLLLNRLLPVISGSQAKTLISAVLELRTIAAHGASHLGDVMPKTSPAVEGLACACALYDLMSCGLPLRSASDQQLGLVSHVHEAIERLESLKRLKASTP